MAIDDNTSYELTGYQVKDLAGRIRLKADASAIPTVNDATLTIQHNGTPAGTFTANQSTNSTVNIETIYADTPGTATTPVASVQASDIVWSTMFQLDDVTVAFANNSKTAKKVYLGSNVYAIMYHGQTGVTSASSGAKQIQITYPAFSNILCAFVKYTVAGQVSPSTGHSSFGSHSADTYVYPNEQAGSAIIADMLIIGTMVD